MLVIPDSGNFQNVPFDRHVKLGQIHADLDDFRILHFVNVTEIHLHVGFDEQETNKNKRKLSESGLSTATSLEHVSF